MQTVTPRASRPEVTPIADGTRHFGGDWESVDEQAALSRTVVEGGPHAIPWTHAGQVNTALLDFLRR